MSASIMSDDRKLIKFQMRHQLGKIIGNHTFRLLAVVLADDRLARPPITTHVRADDSETGGDQLRYDPMPGGGGPWMPVDQEYGRPVAGESYAQPHIPEIDHLVGKSFEHAHLQPTHR